MLAIKHILFPIDFSNRCCGAVPFVEAMASRFGAKITLISVAAPYWYAVDPGVPMVVDIDEVRDQLRVRLDNTLTKEFQALEVNRVVEIGEPAEAITTYAHNNNVDLVMMPTHGYGPFRAFLLGSVTAKVLHDAKCPVWTTAHTEDEPQKHHASCKNVLCAVDGTPQSEKLVKWAAEFVKGDNGRSLRIVHVIAGMQGWPESQLNREFEASMRQDGRAAIEKILQSAGVSAPVCVAAGDIAGSVREEARRHATDVVVIGRGSLHEALGRLRTHSYAIIREAPCPVISV
jgi:nucleotide-binding universal stress UspA family protein